MDSYRETRNAGFLEPRVHTEGRTWTNRGCAAVFYLFVFLQVVLGIYYSTQPSILENPCLSNISQSPNNNPDLDAYRFLLSGRVLTFTKDGATADATPAPTSFDDNTPVNPTGVFYTCPSSYNNHFANGTKNGISNVFRAIQERWYVVVGLFIFGILLILGWMQFLASCSFVAVWGSVFFNLAVVGGMLVYIIMNVGTTGPIVVYGLAFLCMILFIVYFRDRINTAAKVLSLAARCIQENISLLFGVLIMKVTMLVFLAVSCVSTYYIFLGGSDVACPVEVDPYTGSKMRVLEYTRFPAFQLALSMFSYTWQMSLVSTMLIFICGGTTAYWYFHRADYQKPILGNGQGPVSYFTQLAFLQSHGTIVYGALIIAIAKMVKDALRRQQTNTNNVAILVLVCIVKACLWTIVDVIQTISEYSVVIASITGYSFMKSAFAGHGVLFRNFYKAYISDSIARTVISVSTLIMSSLFLVAFSGIFYVSIANGGVAPFAVNAVYAWPLLMLLLVILLPEAGIFICVALPQFFSMTLFCDCDTEAYPTLTSCDEYSVALCAGIFMASLCSMAVNIFGKLIHYSVDGCLMCYAIDKDNGIITE
eukprot:g147.t1